MRELAERAYFRCCLAVGAALRAGRYSDARIVQRGGALEVRKRRRFYAPLLVRLGEPLVQALDVGVRVLRQREWQERERQTYARVYGRTIRIDADGTLVLPFFPGRTLAALLGDATVEPSAQLEAVARSARELSELHRRGITHGDAMAENVLVDLEEGVARWFDFETVHDPSRPIAWGRADDVRALLATCVVRAAPGRLRETLECVVSAYADAEVLRIVTESFGSVFRRPLAFHLGQAPLSLESFRKIHRMLRETAGS